VSGENGSRASSSPPGAASEVRARVGAGRIMVIDDDPIVRDVTQRILRAYGFDVIVCSSGEEGIALYRTLASAIDVVMVDMCMPGMDGYDTLCALRAECPEALVVLCSGAADSARIQKGLEDGAAAFLPKPFTPDALVQLLGRVVTEAHGSTPPSPRAIVR
jgi:CheY-like chemotaxis protein